MQTARKKVQLSSYVTPAGAWALSLGTSIGWGSMVVTSNSYLAHAGLSGSILGIIAGAVIMLIISRNYHYMINCFPSAGGAYLYARESFGYDHGFLTAWFLSLTYFAMLWANATSLPLFADYFLGDMFKFGFHYKIFNYDVFLGEALLSAAAIFLIALLCIKSKKLIIHTMIIAAVILTAAITICFAAAILKHGGENFSFEPGFLPGKSQLSQILLIASISPWAFIGFENISHSSEEFTFPHRKTFRIMVIAVMTSLALYIFLMLLSVSAYPAEYGSWFAYIKNLPNIHGYKGIPAFYAANYYLGNKGIYILMAALFCLILTSLIGNITALSRLLLELANDKVIPESFKQINKSSVPAKAVLLIAAASVPFPFLGRTAISWIVDVTTIGATIVYAFVSASAFKTASLRDDRIEKATGLSGTILMILFGAYMLLPNITSNSTMSQETFLLFTVWGILGFLYFRVVMKRDTDWNFGRSIIVWIALLLLILFISLIWMNQSMHSYTDSSMASIHEHYMQQKDVIAHQRDNELFIKQRLDDIQKSNLQSELVVLGLFLFAMVILLANYSMMNKRAEKSKIEMLQVKDIAMKDPLTGVRSKHAYTEKEKTLDAGIRDGTVNELAIVICDINELKYTNDTLGHNEGDELIKSACKVICECFNHSPVYRVGGDEFAVVLTGRDFFDMHDKMHHIHKLSEDHAFEKNKVIIAAGVSVFEPGSDTCVRDIFKRADKMMYKNKKELKKLSSLSRSAF